MNDLAQFPPDITLAVDGDGVIRTAVSAEALADESIDQWRGVRWTDTVPPEAAEQVAKAVESARNEGESSCFTVNQRLPSGRQLVLEYTTVKLGKKSGFVAIGKNVQDVSDLKSRLAVVQKEREQDYWKLREVETRYRALLDASSEAVALVRVDNLRVVEANAAAAKSLGLVPGAEFLPDLTDSDKKALAGLLETARMNGRAPSIVIHRPESRTLSLRASMLATEAGTFYLFQMAPLDEAGVTAHVLDRKSAPFSLETFVWRLPEGFAILDREGVVQFVNLTFLDMVQAGLESAVVGKNAKVWFNRPGTGLRVILNLVEQHGAVRSLRTTLESELGVHSEVEISAVGDQIDRPRFFGLIVREVTSQGRPGAVSAGRPPEFAGVATSLETAVRSSVEAVERQRLVAALAEFGGNRTAAARSLGISRQSLYTKLKKYGLDRYSAP
jgi:transcriptional regulator PpsR